MGTPDPSRKASRALPDPPAGFDDPLEMLFGCHRRIEKQLPHHLLLHFHPLVRINDEKIEFGAHREVLFQNAPLENPKALVGIGGKVHVHAGFEVFQLGTPI